jgi:glycerophosphoryl diester phosphodiesterase
MRAADYKYFDVPFIPFAHRGGATYPPNLHRENTAFAFGQAVSLGYRYLETDVHATSDGVLLAFHDDRLDRVTDRTGAIGALPYEEVSKARIGGQEPIPRLADLLTQFPAANFNIDAKSDPAVNLLADTIAEHDAYDRVCVSSFDPRRLHRLRRRLGRRVASAASTRGIAWNRFAPLLTRLLNTPAPALQIPAESVVMGRRLQVLTPGLLRAVHRAGKQVHVWTVDDADLIERLLDVGVDGIFTDRIDTLKAVLMSRGRWTSSELDEGALESKED